MFYIGAPMALSERISDSERGLWFTRFSASQMAGICGGPFVLGAMLGTTDIPVGSAFLAVSASALCAALILGAFGYREPRPANRGNLRRWVRDLGPLLRTRAISPILMAGLGGCVFSGIMAFQLPLSGGNASVASSYFLFHALTAIASRLVLGRHVARAPQAMASFALLATMTIGVAALFWVPISPIFRIVSAVLTGFGYGLAYPVIQAWAVNESPQHLRHAALCWFVVAYFLGIFGFPVAGTWILLHFGVGYLVITVALLALAETAVAASALWVFSRRIANKSLDVVATD